MINHVSKQMNLNIPGVCKKYTFREQTKIKPIQANIKDNENKKAEESYKIVISIRQIEFNRVK